MSEVPTVSIITPAYRAVRFLGETIQSVQAQSHADFEMLVVDDASPDDTAALIGEFSAADPRIRCIRHHRNSGPAAARNSALAAARGRYIAFLDSDDLWTPDKLERQLRFMAEQGAAISFTRFRRIDAQGAIISDVIPIPERVDYRRLLRGNVIATSTCMVDREATGPFQMKATFYDDWALWLELLRRGHQAAGLQEDLMRYRVLPGSWSRNKLRSAWQSWRTYRDVERIRVPRALWYFAHYAWNGYRKYRGYSNPA